MRRRMKFGLWVVLTTGVTSSGCGDPCLDDGFGAIGENCNAVASGSGTDSESDDLSATATMGDADGTADASMSQGSNEGSGGNTEEFCRDADGDGYADPNDCVDGEPGNPPPGHIPLDEPDCDDNDPETFPGAAELEDPDACMNDDDDDGWGDDNPGPGVEPGSDCDDDNGNTHPGAAENEDRDACTNDDDDDGWGDADPGPGIDPGSDCDDEDPKSGGDCDALWCLDEDGDGFGDPERCIPGPSDDPPSDDHVPNGDDCDDTDEFTFPGASELEMPPLDMECTRDEDDDGYGDDDPPKGVVPGTDCVDTDMDIRPGAATSEPELCTIDADADGWGDEEASTINPDADNGSDCDDSDPNVAPEIAQLEPELCTIDLDDDGWGDWDAPNINPNAEEGSDCDDGDPMIERCVLLVTQDGTADAALDAPLPALLEGYGLTVVLGEDIVVDAPDADPTALVVITETATSFEVNNKFRDVDEPIVCMEGLIWDDMDIAPEALAVNDTDVEIALPAHPIAAGLAGTVGFMLVDPGSGMFHTAPAGTAEVIATRVGIPGDAVVFAFDEGDVMESGFMAPARRVGFGADVDGGMGTNGQLAPDGLAMFDAAVGWALD